MVGGVLRVHHGHLQREGRAGHGASSLHFSVNMLFESFFGRKICVVAFCSAQQLLAHLEQISFRSGNLDQAPALCMS